MTYVLVQQDELSQSDSLSFKNWNQETQKEWAYINKSRNAQSVRDMVSKSHERARVKKVQKRW